MTNLKLHIDDAAIATLSSTDPEQSNYENNCESPKIIKERDYQCASIDQEYQVEMNKNATNAIEWLLRKLTIDMDRAAREISGLMKDSFSRFRSQYK